MFRTKAYAVFVVLLEPQMFSHKFQSVWALVDIVLMQTQKFFRKYSHGDLTTKILALEHFVLYGIVLCLYIICLILLA